jgi:carboxyl-terminal processing protease
MRWSYMFMKTRIPLSALFSGLAVTLVVALPVLAKTEPVEPLEPAIEHRFATSLATRFMTNYHYRRVPLDNELSEHVFERYFELLDPNRMYFLASDVEELSRYRLELDEALKTRDLEPAFEIFNRYRERAIERVSYARELLASEFDFTVDERYPFDRSEADWIAGSAELDDLWRKRVKNDWLGLMLADRDVDDIRETLDERYGNIERRVRDFNAQDVFQYFMNAYAGSIEPHSSYMSPRLADNFEISMKLSLDGIGALLGVSNEYVEVQEVVTGGPADLDGRLQAGDRIIGVAQGEEDFQDVVGWRLDDVVDLIRGERETVVRLEVLPGETGLKGPAKIIDIVRNEVKLEEQAAQAQVEELELDGETRRIGVIQVPVFYVDFRGRARNEPNYRSSTRDVRRLINELRAENIDGLVVDLRNNGGGALIEATTMTGLFIDEGPVVQIRDHSGRVTVEEDREPGMAWDGPLAVLVNRASASASEIFAAAIQDYGRGVIIGEPTYGKGTVQNLFNLDDYARQSEDVRLGQVKLTMAQFFRVNGGSTQARGVVPDIELPSFGDPNDYGESALDFALPWAEIGEAEYRPLADLSPLLSPAAARHLDRREKESDLRDLIDEFGEFEELSDRTSVTLLETERRREHEEAEARRAARYGGLAKAADSEDEAGSEDPAAEPAQDDEGGSGADESAVADAGEEDAIEEPDVLLQESVRILADLIEFDQEQHRLVQVQATGPVLPGGGSPD